MNTGYDQDSVLKKTEFLQKLIQPSYGQRSEETAKSIIHQLMNCRAALPSIKHGGMKKLGTVLSSQKPIALANIICPDYSYEKTGDPHKPYRFTFKTLNTGIGPVARQALDIAPKFHKSLTRLNIPHHFTFALCDYESRNPEARANYKVTEDEFIENTRLSLKAFLKEINIPQNVYKASLMTEIEGINWDHLVIHEAPKLLSQSSGSSRHSLSKIYEEAVKTNLKYYASNYNSFTKNEDFNKQVLKWVKIDAIKFVSIGLTLSQVNKDYPLIILAYDRPSMAFFYELAEKRHQHPCCVIRINKPYY